MVDFKGKKVALYIRVSTDLDEQKSSIETQREQVEQIKAKGGEINKELIYEDIGISGAKASRPGLDRMKEDARQHKFDVIYTKSISRMMRDSDELTALMSEMSKLGIVIYFAEENICTAPSKEEIDITKLIIMVLAGVADMERLNIKSHIRAGYNIKREAGVPATRWHVPLGYRWVTKQNDPANKGYIEIDEEEADTVRKIFDLFVNGNCSCGTICNLLYMQGIKPRRGEKYDRSGIEWIIKNKRYIGIVTEKGGFEFPGAIPAIIDEKTWYKAQEILAKRKKTAKNTSENFQPAKYPLSKLCFCGKCLAPCTRYGKEAKYTYFEHLVDDPAGANRFWGCTSLSRKKIYKQCGALSVNEYWIYRALIKVAVDLVLEGNYEVDDPTAVDFDLEMKRYNKARQALEVKREKIIDNFEDGVIGKAAFEKRLRKVDEQLGNLVQPSALTAQRGRPLPIDINEKVEEYQKNKAELNALLNLDDADVRIPNALDEQEKIRRALEAKLRLDWQLPDIKRSYIRAFAESIEIIGHDLIIYTIQGPVYKTTVPQRSPAHYHTGKADARIIPYELKVEKVADTHKPRKYLKHPPYA